MPHSRNYISNPVIAAMKGFDKPEEFCYIIKKEIQEHANFLLSEYGMDFDVIYYYIQSKNVQKDLKKFLDGCIFFGYKKQCEKNFDELNKIHEGNLMIYAR